MDIKFMQKILSEIEEERIVNQEFEFLGYCGNILSFFRTGNELNVHILMELPKEEMGMKKRFLKRNLTNRQDLLSSIQDQKEPHFVSCLRGIKFGEQEFEVASANRGIFQFGEQEKIFLQHYIEKKLNFGDLSEKELNSLSMITVTIKGEYNCIPIVEEEEKLSPKVKIIYDDRMHYWTPVKKKIMLSIGDENNRKYRFTSEIDGKTYEFYIEQISLLDPWEDFQKRFSDPDYLRHFSEQEVEEMKRDLEEWMNQICPKGMRFAVVEYESEQASLQIYATEFLKEKKIINNSGKLFFLYTKPDKLTGKHGMRLRSNCIQYPIPPDSTQIEVEVLYAIVESTKKEMERALTRD